MRDEGAFLAMFRSLALSTAQRGQLAAVRLQSAAALYLCKDSSGRPAFLLPVSAVLPPVRLENLEVRHRVRCKIFANGQAIPIASSTLISCLSDDARLQAYFVQALGGVLSAHSGAEDPAVLGSMLEGLSELFQAVSSEPASTAQGLWAELALIHGAADPTSVVKAWHSEVDDLYDFSLGTERVEVKSSSDKTRCHHFRMEQVDSPACVRVLIASMLLDKAGRGLTLGELWDRCRDRLGAAPQLQVKLDALCFRALGKHWHRWRETSYDHPRAIASLTLFDARSIPRPSTPVPAAVSEVRFVADLSGVDMINASDPKYSGPLMLALGFGKLQ